MTKINVLGLSYAAAVVSALVMIALGVLGNFGLYSGAVQMMQQWHVFFSLSVGGIILGAIESMVYSFVLGYVFAVVYNKLSK